MMFYVMTAVVVMSVVKEVHFRLYLLRGKIGWT